MVRSSRPPAPFALRSALGACAASPHHYGTHMRVASVTLVLWTRPCAGLWWCRRRLLVGGPCAYVPESIRYCYALRGPPPIVLGWGGHCANIVMCSHGEVGLRRGLFTTELRKPARRSCFCPGTTRSGTRSFCDFGASVGSRAFWVSGAVCSHV